MREGEVNRRGGPHQELSGELYLVLGPLAKHRGLRAYFETGLFRASDDYWVPPALLPY